MTIQGRVKGSAAADCRSAIVEFQLGLWLERYEEVEREVAVGRVREGKDRAPVVQVALQ
jgi:hypothetical protein